MDRLRAALSQPLSQGGFSRSELAASFKGLENLINNLAFHLSQQELEGIVKKINGIEKEPEVTVEPTPPRRIEQQC